MIRLIFIFCCELLTFNVYSQSILTYFPEPNGEVNCLSIKSDTIYIGGVFAAIGGINRNNIAAVNARTGQVLPLNPTINSTIVLLTYYQNKLYFGANDNFHSGLEGGIESIDLSNGTITNWKAKLAGRNSNYYGRPKAIAAYNNNIFISGSFDSINGEPKKNFAVINATTGNINNSYPLLENELGGISSMVIKDSILYANYSAYNLNTGQKTAWNPNPDNITPLIFAVGNNTIYTGGYFSSIGKQLRNRIAELDLINGNANSWNPLNNVSTHHIMSIGPTNNTVFVSRYVSTTPVSYSLESYDKITGNLIDTWIPNSITKTMVAYGDTIILCGQFTKLGWINRISLVALTRGLSLGVNELNNFIQKISVFPNPATNKISFSLNETNNKTLSVIITNILGKTVFSNTLNYQKEIEIPLTDLNNGIYFIKIQSGNNTYAGKFVKE